VEQGYEILQERWHCRWGELDLVAQSLTSPFTLVFVEVKARTDRNWDAGGLLAITPKKRDKLWRTAEVFLSEHSHLGTLPCRFDVALVHYQVKTVPAGQSNPAQFHGAAIEHWDTPIQIRQPVAIGSYRLTLQDYLLNVFE
jgi:putative endonuclease